jgi:glutamine amidotransferase
MCNLDSVKRAVEECGGDPLVTDQARDIEIANRIILPGVGAFPNAMQNIKQRALDEILREQVMGHQIPFLGICLGMQLLATRGWEVEETEGLGLIPGEVRRLEPFGEDTRIPHIGWNEVCFVRDSPLFKGIVWGKDFYFVHSYHLSPQDENNVIACTPYGKGFVSAVQRGLIFGVQFHPEKSQRLGFQVLKNFLSV